MCNASVYINAMRLADDDGLAESSAGSPAELARLEGYQLLASQMGLCDDCFFNWDACLNFAIVNVTQRAEFIGLKIRDAAPTLLRKSKLWNLLTEQPIHVAVHWLMQGFPHPSFSRLSPELIAYFPYASLDSLSDVQQRSLVGNAMHWASSAAMFLFLLGCTGKLKLLDPLLEDCATESASVPASSNSLSSGSDIE